MKAKGELVTSFCVVAAGTQVLLIRVFLVHLTVISHSVRGQLPRWWANESLSGLISGEASDSSLFSKTNKSQNFWGGRGGVIFGLLPSSFAFLSLFCPHCLLIGKCTPQQSTCRRCSPTTQEVRSSVKVTSVTPAADVNRHWNGEERRETPETLNVFTTSHVSMLPLR